jgi:diguanylate cyclase (GGDEF)-like protein
MTKLDGGGRIGALTSPRSRPTLIFVVLVLLGLTFKLDQSTGVAPIQHLYYLPIVIAGLWLPRYAGLIVGLVAVVLYHLANPIVLASQYRESDIVQIVLFVGVGVVTAKLADDRRQLHRLAITDDLTGLYNLRGFDAMLMPTIRAASQTRTPVTLVVLDVDRLKSINDTHGHRAGADAVRSVGQIVGAWLPDGAFGCRFGGDEFVIALPGHDVPAASEAAEALRVSVHAATPVLAGVPFPPATLSVSVGLACRARFDEPSMQADMAESLFHAADQALYVAKTAGRNQIHAVVVSVDEASVRHASCRKAVATPSPSSSLNVETKHDARGFSSGIRRDREDNQA